ncbi:right-handed parallel beta-helix repeat-containing protein [Frateuria hangzhouensis]|uniref:right-handed parallel beta-helix repeat-containing protein n=1 Tax=Frateuria hangzhouensis TaxID=2995589 RepID=UPI002260DFF4|nr:right-handed parallel beta-helix repeat-containing protein [Frateuria sp. STR12]MCX7513934.1 right-handed parallel beta-helix repeat-containing protein [Frateuria sp. STR12]
MPIQNLFANQTLASRSPSVAAVKRSTVGVKKPLILALAALAFAAPAVPAFAATQWWSTKPKVEIGHSAQINVRDKGAKGDGVHNDTAAIQAAINALPASGGTVKIPAGRYMIDAEKSIRMRSHTRLLLDTNAELVVIPNSLSRSRLIRVWNVTDVRIVGGKMLGDRAKHKGTRGEWGMGIDIIASKNVVVKGTHLSEFWGDGIYIGAKGSGRYLKVSENVTIMNVVSDHNRRQGLSITPAKHVYVVNSTFSNTRGTLPEAGIDIEPQVQGPTSSIRLENNTFVGNHGNGIELHTNISDIAIVGNKMTTNRGFGVLSVGASNLKIQRNHATLNKLAAVGITRAAHDVQIVDNVLQFNSTRYMSATKSGGGLDRDLQVASGTYRVSVSGNTFSNTKYNNYTR